VKSGRSSRSAHLIFSVKVGNVVLHRPSRFGHRRHDLFPTLVKSVKILRFHRHAGRSKNICDSLSSVIGSVCRPFWPKSNYASLTIVASFNAYNHLIIAYNPAAAQHSNNSISVLICFFVKSFWSCSSARAGSASLTVWMCLDPRTLSVPPASRKISNIQPNTMDKTLTYELFNTQIVPRYILREPRPSQTTTPPIWNDYLLILILHR